MSLEAEIWAWRLGRGAEEEKNEEKRKEEKIPHMCESIGHKTLRGHCPAPLNYNPNPLKHCLISRARVPLTI